MKTISPSARKRNSPAPSDTHEFETPLRAVFGLEVGALTFRGDLAAIEGLDPAELRRLARRAA